MGNTMKTKTMYEIREFGHKGSCYSRAMFGGRLVERSRALRIVKRLKRSGRDVKATTIKIAA